MWKSVDDLKMIQLWKFLQPKHPQRVAQPGNVIPETPYKLGLGTFVSSTTKSEKERFDKGKIFLLETIDTEANAHTAEYLQELAQQAIHRNVDMYKFCVAGFVTDNAANVTKIRARDWRF